MQVKLIAITHYLDDDAVSSAVGSEALLEREFDALVKYSTH